MIGWSAEDDLLDAVWEGRIVSELTLTSRINAVRHAIGDTGANQTLIKTIARKGFRFIGEVEEVKKALPQASAGGDEAATGGLRQEIHSVPRPTGCASHTPLSVRGLRW